MQKLEAQTFKSAKRAITPENAPARGGMVRDSPVGPDFLCFQTRGAHRADTADKLLTFALQAAKMLAVVCIADAPTVS
jgi:hypothetical protein